MIGAGRCGPSSFIGTAHDTDGLGIRQWKCGNEAGALLRLGDANLRGITVLDPYVWEIDSCLDAAVRYSHSSRRVPDRSYR